MDRVNIMTEDRSTIVYHLLNAEVFRSGMGWVSSWTFDSGSDEARESSSSRGVYGCSCLFIISRKISSVLEILYDLIRADERRRNI